MVSRIYTFPLFIVIPICLNAQDLKGAFGYNFGDKLQEKRSPIFSSSKVVSVRSKIKSQIFEHVLVGITKHGGKIYKIIGMSGKAVNFDNCPVYKKKIIMGLRHKYKFYNTKTKGTRISSFMDNTRLTQLNRVIDIACRMGKLTITFEDQKMAQNDKNNEVRSKIDMSGLLNNRKHSTKPVKSGLTKKKDDKSDSVF